EDGIRDFHVTGVQTCALPICGHSGWVAARQQRSDAAGSVAPAVRRGEGGSLAVFWQLRDRGTGPAAHRRTNRPAAGRSGAVAPEDRKSVVEGKSVEGGGRRLSDNERSDSRVSRSA